MSEQSIDRIVEDLRRLDPAFRNDPNLSRIVREMAAERPHLVLDDDFRQELRMRLTGSPAMQPIKSPYQRWFWFAPALAVVLIAVFVGRTSFFNREPTDELAFAPEIVELQGQAFGSLASETVSPNTPTAMPLASERSALPPGESMAMGLGSPYAVSAVPKDTGGNADAMSSMIYPYPMTEYVYEYAGEENPLTEKSGAVLKRLAGVSASQSLIAAISKAKFGGLDLAGFRDLEIQNLQVAENRPGGYMVNIDFIGGYVSLNKNWKFGNPYGEIPAGEPQKIDDAEAIRIANSFLSSHKISTASFGRPIVEPMPDIRPMMMEEGSARSEAGTTVSPDGIDSKMIAYWPQSVTVVYPLEIDGREARDEGGALYGMRVMVNVHSKDVESVYDLSPQNFERSSYPLMTEVSSLMSYLNKRSAFSFPRDEKMEVKKERVKLGTPTQVYMRYWKYDASGGQSSEYLIPAALFPIVEGGEGHYMKVVIVPLLDELLKTEYPSDPVYRIMEGQATPPAPAE